MVMYAAGTYEVEITGKSINFKAATSRICHAVAACDRSLVWLPNYVVARKMGIDSSALGRITAACRVTVGQQSFDVGVSVRHGNDLCVPGISRPSPEGKLRWICHERFWYTGGCGDRVSSDHIHAAAPFKPNFDLQGRDGSIARKLWRC